MTELWLPHKWDPRPYQMEPWHYLAGGGKRLVLVCHRRWGKDTLSVNFTAVSCLKVPGLYWHMAPSATQARKIIWDGRNKEGVRIIDQAFPREIRKRTNDTEMKIEFVNGSLWQCVGSDNYDSLVGSNPRGIVFSEYSLANPAAWDYFRPMLLENGGWAIFPYTPRGKNHGWHLFDQARQSDDWLAIISTNDDTGVFSRDDIEKERREITLTRGADEANAIINQEYFCSFEAALLGSYYGTILERAQREGRITSVPHEPALPVYAAWDLGVSDSCAIWFFQVVNGFIHVIDYMEHSGAGYDFYAKKIKETPYIMHTNYCPHDIEQREQSSALSRRTLLQGFGIGNVVALPASSVMSGINEARMLLARCRFDETNCKRGLDALRNYQKKWDDKRHDWSESPLHDWSSHGADAFRYLAQGYKYHNPVRQTEYRHNEVIQGKIDWGVF